MATHKVCPPEAFSICELCKESFSYETGRARERRTRRRFCGLECYYESMRLHGRPEINKGHTKTCAWCKASFAIMPHDAARRIFCSSKCRGEWQSSLPYDQWRGKLSANLTNRSRGEKNAMWGKTSPHGRWQSYQRPNGEQLRLRSTWELAVAIFLDANEISYEYEPKRFRLRDRTYVPDFFLIEQNMFWEVKGWMHLRHAETIRQFREMQPGTPLVVIGKGAIRGIAKASGIDIGR